MNKQNIFSMALAVSVLLMAPSCKQLVQEQSLNKVEPQVPTQQRAAQAKSALNGQQQGLGLNLIVASRKSGSSEDVLPVEALPVGVLSVDDLRILMEAQVIDDQHEILREALCFRTSVSTPSPSSKQALNLSINQVDKGVVFVTAKLAPNIHRSQKVAPVAFHCEPVWLKIRDMIDKNGYWTKDEDVRPFTQVELIERDRKLATQNKASGHGLAPQSGGKVY